MIFIEIGLFLVGFIPVVLNLCIKFAKIYNVGLSAKKGWYSAITQGCILIENRPSRFTTLAHTTTYSRKRDHKLHIIGIQCIYKGNDKLKSVTNKYR